MTINYFGPAGKAIDDQVKKDLIALNKIDLVTTWPDTQKYPPFVAFLRANHTRFEKIIIYISEMNYGWEMRDQIIDSLKDIPNMYICDPVERGDKDWRQVATLECLKISKADFVWFIEQDFFMTKHFVDNLIENVNNFEVIGFRDSNRLHPACLVVSREVIDKTGRDFSADPPTFDHFAMFTAQAEANGKTITLDELDLKENRDWYHFAGLSHNHNLEQQGKEANHKPDEFRLYKFISEWI